MAEQTFAPRAPSRPLVVDRLSPGILLPLAVLFGLLGQFLFYGHDLGLNWPLATVLLLGTAWFVRARGARLDRLDVWIVPAALAFALLPAVRTERSLAAFDIPATVALSGMAAVAMAGVPVTRRAVDMLTALGVIVLGKVLAGGAVLIAALPELTLPLARRGGGRILSVGVGLALAFPFLVLFAVLFSSADAVFSSALSNVFDLKKWSFGELIGRTLLAAVLAWMAGGVFIVAGRGAEVGMKPLLPTMRGFLSSTAATTMLLAIDALFVFFVALQLTYLFGGRDTLDATGLTYSDYARRGFFELIYAAIVVGGLLFAVELLLARRPKLFAAAAVVLLAATLLIVVSAAYRMHLYQLAYGWTEQRFYALAGIVWLGTSAGIAIALVLRDSSRWLLHAAAIAALVIALGANLLGPAAFVARQNLERVIDPSGLPADAYRGLDVFYLVSLGEGAVPVALEYLPRAPQPWRERLGAYLRNAYALGEPDRHEAPPPWQSFNLDRERARQAILGAADHLRTYPPVCDVSRSGPPCLPYR